MSPIFGKVEGCRTATLISNESITSVFFYFPKFFRTHCLQNTYEWKLLFTYRQNGVFPYQKSQIPKDMSHFFVFVSYNLRKLYLMVYFAFILLVFVCLNFVDLNIIITIFNYGKKMKKCKVQKVRTYTYLTTKTLNKFKFTYESSL